MIAPPKLPFVACALQFLKWFPRIEVPNAVFAELSSSRRIPPPVEPAPLNPKLAIRHPAALIVRRAVLPDPFLICGSPPCVLPLPTPMRDRLWFATGMIMVSA